MNKYLATKKVKKLIEHRASKIMLNIGCGTDYKEGWINIDNNSDNNISRLDLNWDLRKSLPFENDSVDYIFNEHFIEHLTVEESRKSLDDFFRVLKPGGVMRIAMPDMEDIVELYKDDNWKNRPVIKNHGFEDIQTRAEMVNLSFRAWGHKWIYDWEELERRLKEVGGKNIRRQKLGMSKHKVLMNLETREGSILIAETEK